MLLFAAGALAAVAGSGGAATFLASSNDGIAPTTVAHVKADETVEISPSPRPTRASPVPTLLTPPVVASELPLMPSLSSTSTEQPTPMQLPSKTPSVEIAVSARATAVQIGLVEPSAGSTVSGPVTFRWGSADSLGANGTYDVRVCKGAGCIPQLGKTNTRDTTWLWCPDEEAGEYRWQVVIIDAASKRPLSSPSTTRRFLWVGGSGCEQESDGGDGDGGGSDPSPTCQPGCPTCPGC